MSAQTDGAPVGAGARAGRIAQNVAALLRLRFQDARADVKSSFRSLAMGAVFGLAAIVLALLALPVLITTVILILSMYLPAWAAAGIVLAVMLVAVGGLFLFARSRLRWKGPSLPQELKADWEAIRERLKERQ
jgi:hypothetical protein